MGTQPKNPAVVTIGHSSLSEDAFVDLLRAYGIATVIDVRGAPYSRCAPHFNRPALRTTLARHGIGYAFAGEKLGGRPTDPACYKDGEVPEGHADDLNLVDDPTVARQPWYREGIDRLLELADGNLVALMCSEEDPGRCHRYHLIAQTLRELDTEVRHIRRSGELQQLPPLNHQLDLFAQPA
jgi:uncharacterized protein (DUF488 family)